ncbi:DEKNAAC103687 [Brettanomyces naardenensis]|uniref:DEKNAAC103687 n=1 Tax=Brettanomyces naardenensis TaxID=13370 RepID=A0A448YNL6_BRENA|nr:DEKNAAC103687 [Brettanomyces naardenensis]
MLQLQASQPRLQVSKPRDRRSPPAAYTNDKIYIGFFDCAAYWTKVAGEVAKQVYLKEGLAPPKTTEFKQVYDDAINQGLSFIKNPKGYSTSLVRSSQNFTTNDIVKYTSYLLQILGFFALGEIIGRRQVVGYPKYGPSAEATD